jgi:hypothetical protein
MRDYFAPRRYWKWTRWTLIAAGVFFCALYVQGYRNEWSAAERLDLKIYLESGVWGTLSKYSSTSYSLLVPADGGGQPRVCAAGVADE